MLDKEPTKGWNAIDFDDSAWMETTTDVYYQNWSQNTIYFRYELNVTDSIKYPVVEYGIWYKDGIIIYLNGEEVCRRNMPSGTIEHSTMASATFVGYYQRVGSAPGYLLRDGKNVIAVEIHRHDSTSGEIQFSGYANALQGDCVSRVSGGTITESSFYNRPDYSAAQAWDGLETTEWIENGSPAWTVYSYNFDRMEWVNRFVLVSSSNAERDPKEFHLYGSRDGMNWEELVGEKSTALFSARKERKEYPILEMDAYSAFRFEMMDSVSGLNKLSMSVIDLMTCQLNYCVKDDVFPSVMLNATAAAECPEGMIGEMFRKCELVAERPQWSEVDMSHCKSTKQPLNKAYIDVVYYLTNVTMEMMESGLGVKMGMVIAEAAKVQTSVVQVWYLKDISNEYEEEGIPAVAVWVRFTLDDENASSVFVNVKESVSVLGESLKSEFGSELPASFNIGFYKEPVLHARRKIPMALLIPIMIAISISLVFVIFVSIYICIRTRPKYKSAVKKLRSGRVEMEEVCSDGSSSSLCVC